MSPQKEKKLMNNEKTNFVNHVCCLTLGAKDQPFSFKFLYKLVSYVFSYIFVMLVCLWYFQNFLSISYEYQYMLIISSAWIYMRGQSYCLDKLSSADTGPSVSDFVMMLGYCFYFPTLFLGPLVVYQEFEAGVLKPYAPWTLQRIKTFVLHILRYVWWMLFLELFLHYVYIGALQKKVQVSALQNKVLVSALQKKVHVSALQKKVHVSALQKKVHVSALQKKVQVSALQKKVHVSALQKKVHVSALQKKVQVSVLQKKVQVSDLQKKVQVSALQKKVQVRALQKKVHVSALQKKVQVSALQKKVQVS
jgi:hypothetical protein